MKYQHFSEKLMILDREEEMRRNMMGGYGADMYGQGPSNGGYDLNELNKQVYEQPDMTNIGTNKN